MMLSYPGMESELLYPLSRAASLRSAPAGEPGVALGQGTAGSFQVQAKTEKGPEAAHVQTSKMLHRECVSMCLQCHIAI